MISEVQVFKYFYYLQSCGIAYVQGNDIYTSPLTKMIKKLYVWSWKIQRTDQYIVSKFKFFILKLQEFARLFAAMGCVTLVFPPQKLNSNDTLQQDTIRFNAAFFSSNSSSFCCAIYSTNVQIEQTWKDSCSPRA